MEIKKRYTNEKELKSAIAQFKAGKMDTEVLSNLYNPTHQKYNKVFTDFMLDMNDKKASYLIQAISDIHEFEAYKNAFGKPDFVFEGNRKYNNYFVEFNGLTFVASSKTELVMDNVEINKELFQSLVDFKKSHYNLVMKYVLDNNLIKEAFKEAYEKEIKPFINSDNTINFEALHTPKSAVTKLVDEVKKALPKI